MQSLILLLIAFCALLTVCTQTVMLFLLLWKKPEANASKPEANPEDAEAIRKRQEEYIKYIEGWNNLMNYNGTSQKKDGDLF